MAYPTNPALNSSQALYPDLWNGLIWAYLPGYNKTTPIVGGDTLGGSTTTTLDVYAEGTGETFDLGEYRVGATTPLNGTTAGTIHAHYRMLWANDGTASGVLGTAASTTWANVGQLVINDTAGSVRGVWKRGGVEALVTGDGVTHNASTNPVVNALTWRDATTVGVHDFLIAEVTASGAGVAGALTNTEPVIVGSYFDRSNERSSNIAFFCGAIWNRTLTTVEKNLLASDPFAVFQRGASGAASASFTVTAADATFSGSGYVQPMASFAVTAASAAFSGSASTGAASATINGTAANATFSGSATGDTSTGVIATPALKNNAGTVLANETGVTVYVYNPTTGALVVKKTGQTTSASGVLTVTDALIAAGTQYRVVIVLGSGAEGMDKITAS